MLIYVGIDTDNRCYNSFFDPCAWCVLPRMSENKKGLQTDNSATFPPSMCLAVWGGANTKGDRSVSLSSIACILKIVTYLYFTLNLLCAFFSLKLPHLKFCVLV